MRLMYDSTSAGDIPVSAVIVGGYVDGLYKWSDADWARFPSAIKVRIAVFASTNDGHVLDVEQGDATPAEAPGWVIRRRQAGVDPTIYCNRGNIAAIKAAFSNAGVPLPHFWLATLDGSTPWDMNIVAIQYAGQTILLQHYDLSIVSNYWPGVDPPLPLLPIDPGSLLPLVHPIVTQPLLPPLPPARLPAPPQDPCATIKADRDAALAKLTAIKLAGGW